jgi:hypothetical protein
VLFRFTIGYAVLVLLTVILLPGTTASTTPPPTSVAQLNCPPPIDFNICPIIPGAPVLSRIVNDEIVLVVSVETSIVLFKLTIGLAGLIVLLTVILLPGTTLSTIPLPVPIVVYVISDVKVLYCNTLPILVGSLRMGFI